MFKMKKLTWLNRAVALAVVSVVGFAASQSVQAGKPPKGFTALFNEKDLSGWWGLKTEDPVKWKALSADKLAEKKAASLKDIAQHWSVNGEELVNDGHGLYLSTQKNYGDFEFLVDYKTVPKADSGIYLRGIPQVQIWDSTEEAKFNIGANKGSGGLWNNSKGAPGKDPLVLADKPFGQWNSFRIIMVGERVSVWLNGKLLVDHARMENYFNRKGQIPRTGPIQLQTHGGEIRWRNVFIREIGTNEGNEILASKGGNDFESVFNGKNFDGWAGPVKNYSVAHGEIQCLKGKGGTIYVNEELADFSARMEFKLPPGGNNGLAIRYPGVPIAGTFTGNLDNDGENIALIVGGGDIVHEFTYNDASDWPSRSDGVGSSLEVSDPDGDYNEPVTWRASGEYNGSPGVAGNGAGGR